MKFIALALVALLAACAGADSIAVGRTPAMATVCQSSNDSWQDVLDVAQEECEHYARSAQFLSRDGDCATATGVGGRGLSGTAIHFKCIRN
ncbi:MAG: hypothetical protein GC131_09435 [Alphaproteobacteria bacterium]|nr:hypothetical protein [Alphaproteobacteria bacterium]